MFGLRFANVILKDPTVLQSNNWSYTKHCANNSEQLQFHSMRICLGKTISMTIIKSMSFVFLIGVSGIAFSQQKQDSAKPMASPTPMDLPDPMLLFGEERRGMIVKSLQELPPSVRSNLEQGLKAKKGTFSTNLAKDGSLLSSGTLTLEYWDLGVDANGQYRTAKAIAKSANVRSRGITERDFSLSLSDIRASPLSKLNFQGLLPSSVTAPRPWTTAMRVFSDEQNNIYTLQEDDLRAGRSAFMLRERMNVTVNGNLGTLVRLQSQEGAVSWTLLWVRRDRTNELAVHCDHGACLGPEQVLKLASSIRFVE